jgi:hypothetical protein
MRPVWGDLDDETRPSKEADHFLGLDRIVLDDEDIALGLVCFEQGA